MLPAVFEEGTSAAWFYELLKPHVRKVTVCDPRTNALLKAGNKNDRIDARKLAESVATGLLSPVSHGECGVRFGLLAGREAVSYHIASGRCGFLSGQQVAQ